MYKHYIRLNNDNDIIKVFCDAFETPIEGDILFKESEERHFYKKLTNEDDYYIYRYNANTNNIIKKTNNQIYNDKLPEYKEKVIEKIKKKSFNILLKTDWQIIRHKNQKAQGTQTTLTDIEYQNLLEARQHIRDQSSAKEGQILAASTYAQIVALI